MMFLDTHVVLWLYEGLLSKFPANAIIKLNHHHLVISPMVQLELQYLYEIKRSACIADKIINELNAKIGLTVSDLSFSQIIQSASQLNWTRDPFDRIIVATAMLGKHLLLTKDSHIHQHYEFGIWG